MPPSIFRFRSINVRRKLDLKLNLENGHRKKSDNVFVAIFIYGCFLSVKTNFCVNYGRKSVADTGTRNANLDFGFIIQLTAHYDIGIRYCVSKEYD